jgi:hypothetical protein
VSTLPSSLQVNSIQSQEKNKGSSTEKLAVSLLNSLEAAFKAKGPGAAAPKTWTWDKDLRQAVLSVLETNQVSLVGRSE